MCSRYPRAKTCLACGEGCTLGLFECAEGLACYFSGSAVGDKVGFGPVGVCGREGVRGYLFGAC